MLKHIAANILKRYLNRQFLKKEIKKAFRKRYRKASITQRQNRVKVPILYQELAEDMRIVNAHIFKGLVKEALNEIGVKYSKSRDAYYFAGCKKT